MHLTHLASISVSASSSWNISKTSQHVHMVLLMLVYWNPSWLVLPQMHEQKTTYIEFLMARNRTLQKSTGKVKPLQESLVLHTMKSFIPNVLNDVLDFFFADHIFLFLCKYEDIESCGRYSNLSTKLFDEDTSVNLGGVDFGSLISHSGKDVRSDLVTKYFFGLAEGLSRVLCNRVPNLFSIYQ